MENWKFENVENWKIEKMIKWKKWKIVKFLIRNKEKEKGRWETGRKKGKWKKGSSRAVIGTFLNTPNFLTWVYFAWIYPQQIRISLFSESSEMLFIISGCILCTNSNENIFNFSYFFVKNIICIINYYLYENKYIYKFIQICVLTKY